MTETSQKQTTDGTDNRDKLGMAVTVAENAGFAVSMNGTQGCTASDERGTIALQQDEDEWTVRCDDTNVVQTDDFRLAFDKFCDLVI